MSLIWLLLGILVFIIIMVWLLIAIKGDPLFYDDENRKR